MFPFTNRNFSFPPSHSPVHFDRPMVIQQAPRAENNVENKVKEEIKNFDDGSDNRHWDLAAVNVIKQESEEMENWENTFHMRPFNLSNFPSGQATYRTTHRSHSVAMNRARIGYVSSTAAKSLDILRHTLQKSINKEIGEVITKYLEKFFKPGIENIKKNNGTNSVSEEHIQTVCRQMLEEAKKMYMASHTRGSTPIGDWSDSETGSQTDSQWKVGRPFARVKGFADKNRKSPSMRKRKDSDTDSEASQIPIKPVKKKGRPPLYLTGGISGRSTPSKNKNEPVKKEGPKWNPERLTKDAVFVMGARANKALGFGQTRGRLYIKHPELFKYCGDAEDKLWLYENKLMPATGGKAYLLLLEDLKELAETEEYRNSEAVMLDELVGFHPPENMLEKMRIFMNAMRTDLPGGGGGRKRGRPFASIENTTTSEQTFDIKSETMSLMPDFASASPESSSRMDMECSAPGSPVDELDLRDGASPNQPSPFLLPMGLDDVSPANADVSPSPSELNAALENAEDPPLSAPFDI